MKTIVGIVLILFLTGCQQQVELMPVTAPAFTFNLVLEEEIYQGEHNFDQAMLQELLPGHSFERPHQYFNFELKLTHAAIQDEGAFDFENQQITVDASGIIHFDPITFPAAGTYTFSIRQTTPVIDGWTFDEQVVPIHITIREDTYNNMLIDEMILDLPGFINTFIYDVASDIEQALTDKEQERLSAMQADMALIEDVFLSLGGVSSFYFYHLETGFRHAFNGDHVFYGASTPKVFYAHWLYTYDELGKITLTDTERLWIQYSLRTSLDEFSLNLQARYGLDAYHQWLTDAGIQLLHANTNFHYGLSTKFTAYEAVILMQGIYQYFLTKTPNALEFRENMINNQAPFIVSNDYDVASKTGWLFPQEVRHDVAIVEASSPYILVILTQYTRATMHESYYFGILSALFEEFNRKWFE